MESLRARWGVAALVLILGAIWVAPNFFNLQDTWWPSEKRLNYGLDIQGGLHLVMGVDVEGVLAESSQRLASNIRVEMRQEGLSVEAVRVTNPLTGEIVVEATAPDQRDSLERFLSDRYGTVLQVLRSSGRQIETRYYETYLRDYQRRVIQQAIETIRNRIDEFGVSEPSITAQGDDRILVQLPGIEDAERAKALINTAARLDFMLVSTDLSQERLERMIAEAQETGDYSLGDDDVTYSEYVARLNADLKDQLPENTVIYFEVAENASNLEAGRIPYLLSTTTDLTGEALDDAFVSFNEFGIPEVSLVFNPVGAQKFADLTGNNVNRQMAVVLDRVVKSAPNIQQRIGGGRAVITLGSARNRDAVLDEARMIATSLRAGALPAELQQLEERTVGPTLGADSIRAASIAGVIGATLVILFMLAYYKTMGVIANICLAVNVTLVLAILTTLEATLTLPGVAGIALTIGMAVDANVIIYERIKEELRRGTAYRLAAKEGYSRALSAIVDANITTAATALVLMYYGTGPVRGFAVTLLIGIVTTLFTGVFLSRLLTDYFVHRSRAKKLAI